MRRAIIAALFVALLQTSLAAPALAKTSKVDVARANAAAVRARLAAVTKQLQAQIVRSQSATQAASAARQHLRVAQAELGTVENRLATVRASVRDIALRVYMSGVGDAGFNVANLDPNTAARANFLRASVIGSQNDAADQLAATRQDLQIKQRAAESAARVAQDRSRAAGQAVASLRASQAAQLRLVSAAESRYLASLSEAALASRSIRARGSKVSLTTVRGITVASSIAGNLERLLSAADSDGMHFGGTGYRSYEGQVAARRSHCGSSDYDVYSKPASQCHPPTARPGQSMHEQGLAIDFTYNGSVIRGHDNAGFRWLRANAARFGFYNLPSEAWHWSVNGN